MAAPLNKIDVTVLFHVYCPPSLAEIALIQLPACALAYTLTPRRKQVPGCRIPNVRSQCKYPVTAVVG
jgi:hypothetical protein